MLCVLSLASVTGGSEPRRASTEHSASGGVSAGLGHQELIPASGLEGSLYPGGWCALSCSQGTSDTSPSVQERQGRAQGTAPHPQPGGIKAFPGTNQQLSSSQSLQ